MHKIEISKAIKSLMRGDIIIYPTDTLYAIGVDIYNDSAVRKVFKVKKRPLDTPLPIAVSDISNIEEIAIMNKVARKLIDRFLPGPLTLILKKKSIIPDVVNSSLDNIAIRIPNNDIALELLSKFSPLTVTSANIHGQEVKNNVNDIKVQLNTEDIDFYLDYGKLNGLPSTIVDLSTGKARILREGLIKRKELLDVI